MSVTPEYVGTIKPGQRMRGASLATGARGPSSTKCTASVCRQGCARYSGFAGRAQNRSGEVREEAGKEKGVLIRPSDMENKGQSDATLWKSCWFWSFFSRSSMFDAGQKAWMLCMQTTSCSAMVVPEKVVIVKCETLTRILTCHWSEGRSEGPHVIISNARHRVHFLFSLWCNCVCTVRSPQIG